MHPHLLLFLLQYVKKSQDIFPVLPKFLEKEPCFLFFLFFSLLENFHKFYITTPIH